jgi:ABC-type amino acid transport substrate-binding protein
MRQAGCVKGKPGTVHVAASPLFRGGQAVLETLDKGVQQMRASKELATLLQEYGMQDWQPVLVSGK